MYSILYSITTQENGVWQVYCGLLSSNNMIIFYEHGYRISLTLYRSVGGELTKVARNGIDDDRCIDALCNILCRYIIRLCSYSPVILWYHVILPWYHVILTSIPCDTTSFDSLGSWHGPWYQASEQFHMFAGHHPAPSEHAGGENCRQWRSLLRAAKDSSSEFYCS